MSRTLQSNGYSLQSVGYSPGVLNPPYTRNALEWLLLFIFNSAVFKSGDSQGQVVTGLTRT